MKINEFREEYFFLSNFYPCKVTYDGITYQNTEAAFQAQKCTSLEERKKFADLNATESKKLGRAVPLRKDWEAVKVSHMREILRCKFTQNEDLMEKLLQTKDAYLEEGNTWGDKTWVARGLGDLCFARTEAGA